MITGRFRPVLFKAMPVLPFTPAGDSGVIFRLWPVSSSHQSWTLCSRTQQRTRSIIVIYSSSLYCFMQKENTTKCEKTLVFSSVLLQQNSLLVYSRYKKARSSGEGGCKT